MAESAEADPDAFPDFQAFFTRALRPGARPLCPDDNGIACPADGTLSQFGRIPDDRLIQAKGRSFGATELVGGSPERAAPFKNGEFATIYLAPPDYHRVHMPVSGTLREMVHVPGRAFSVNPATTSHIPGLFARNERVVALFDTDSGPLAVVLVGAMLVATIETAWAGTITPPSGRRVRAWSYPGEETEAVRLNQGEELGRFNLGSTVILMFPRGEANWDPNLRPTDHVRMGQCLGGVTPSGE
ncbi:MAG: archaetidylserine decarboxylase [Thiohalorhabdus sp.]